MKLTLARFSHDKEATLGLLAIDGRFACYTLEDEHRDVKVPGETRIPAGTYEVKLRTVGGFHHKYAKVFPDIHRGMLHVQNVPGFEYILIHTGNTDADTRGCILVGDRPSAAPIEPATVAASKKAYRRIYPPIAEPLAAGGRCFIEVKTFA